MIGQQTAPGVYTSITDKSFLTNVVSRFRCGLLGVATKGPFDTVINTRSSKEFRQNFGTTIPGHYLATAAAVISEFTDGAYIVRVGRQHTRVTVGGSGGGAGSAAYKIYTPGAKLFNINDFVRVTQGGKVTTVNAKVESYLPPGATQGNATGLQLVSTGTEAVALADNYTSVTLDKNELSGAASNAEAFLYAYDYSTPQASLGYVQGDKNSKKFTLTGTVLPVAVTLARSGTVATATTLTAHNLTVGNVVTITGAGSSNLNRADAVVVSTPLTTTFTYAVANTGATSDVGAFTVLAAGDLIRIVQDGRVTTAEVRVKDVLADGTVHLEPASISELGYQVLALQDNYTTAGLATVAKVKRNADGTPVAYRAIHMIAATAGTWANSDGSRTGLIVRVAPGSAPGTKKLLVYETSALVETIDNLSTDPDSPNYYVTRINGRSSYIAIPTDDSGIPTGIIDMPSGVDVGTFQHPANTAAPWNLSRASVVNFAAFGATVSEFDSTLGQQVVFNLAIGYNGDNPSVADVVGSMDPNTDEATGLQLFRDTEVVKVNVLCAPGITDVAVHQELAIVARETNAIAFGDIPDSTDPNEPVINPRQAVDWHNGVGLFSNRSRIDSPNLAVFFNWFKIVDPFSTVQIFVPPTLAALRTAARTFDREKPWLAFAGENRGIVDIALAVRFPKISLDTKSSMYGNGNSVNPILLTRGRIMVYGNRTMQVAESKLSAINGVILTNYIVDGMAVISRRFVFEPNDQELLLELNNAFSKLLETVKSERGIEEYKLILDESNNNATTRNLREVIVDISFVPIDAVERIYINATVRESGAALNAVQ